MYVDKTKIIPSLLGGGVFFPPPPPRRFGKSLLVATLKALFGGRGELFEGLWIYDKYDWGQKYPVVAL